MRTAFTALLLALGSVVVLGAPAGSPAAAAPSPEKGHATLHYVAIGDSYTTGAGIPPGVRAGCNRSPKSYPNRLARHLDLTLTDASCAGAVIGDLTQGQPIDTGVNEPQAAPLGADTDLVTISLGINDADYSGLMTTCAQVAPSAPDGSPCRDSFIQPDGSNQLFNLVAGLGAQLRRGIHEVKSRAPNAEVVVIGYPRLAPTTGTCADLPFAAGDYAFVNEWLHEVDLQVRRAAHRAGVEYVDLWAPSAGHDVCAGSKAWIQGDYEGPRAYGLHPYATEHRAVAQLVAATLRRS